MNSNRNTPTKQRFCDDEFGSFKEHNNDDPVASYFLNTKLSEQEAHARFMDSTPSVFNEHKNFTNTVTTVPETKVGEKPINNGIDISTDQQPQTNKLKDPNVQKATTYSDCVPAINFTHKRNDDNDDDDSVNMTKLLDLLVSCANGSILATLELNTIIAKMKKAEGEIMDPIDCNNYINDYECNNARMCEMCNPLSIVE